ncbi:LOW QUALITY PROTEIN: Retroelement [Phytophthora megakarya]|uniref:Retroelement n=1 Tax=Phytophthora megakarya TaxID=4795 RepID=A0A225VUG5_9STRA|nr:LOW QUALITY PROTEIN: Retroelement [Phytophthora megakarya]
MGSRDGSNRVHSCLTSPHGVPTFCVRKPDGWRIVHDFRVMNLNTVRRTMSMSRKDKILEKMQGAYYFSCLDLLSGYYQFRMREAGIPYTAFQALDGLYEYLLVPMGLSNAPATFNDGIRKILGDLVDICQSYFDDIYHLNALDRVFARLDEHKFFVKLSKCVFCADSIPCLGDIVGCEGVKISPNKGRSFLGTAAYVQRFCQRFADDAGPLFNLLKSKNKQVEWTPTLTEHFERLKAKVVQTPVLAIPDFDKDFSIDASDFAVGGVLYQKEVHDGVKIERPVAFAGRKYKPAELNYSIREKELLAFLFGLRTWRVYLLDRPFVVETDHKSLDTMFKQKSVSRRIASWYDELAEYQFQIQYIKGAENSVADGISHRPDFMASAEPVTLAAMSTRQQVRQRVDASLSATVAEAVRRYDEDDTTKALLRLLDPRYSAKKDESTPLAAPRLLERYSLIDERLFYQAGHHASP